MEIETNSLDIQHLLTSIQSRAQINWSL
jgi:hypothetical protein